MIRALRNLARVVVFGKPKRVPKYIQFREAKQRTTAKLRAELRDNKLQAVNAHIVGYRAVAEALEQ